MKNIIKNQRRYVPFMLLDIILAQLQRPVASSEALDLLYWAMHVVTYQSIVMAIKTASKVGVFFHRHLFACHPGCRWGNTEQVVAQWRHPVTSSIALDMLHWAMPRVLLQRIRMAIKTFVCHCCLFCLL
jgi:hypothetical protein